MRSIFAVALIATILFSGGYLYYTALAICPVPLEYRLGQFDDRFAITRDEARIILSDAEAVWEDATGRNLFTYNTDAEFTVNFVFDERQAFAEAESDFRDRLNSSADMNSEIRQRYERLLEQFDELDAEYEAKRGAFEADRETYNERVRRLEETGEITQAKLTEIEAEQKALNEKADEINTLAEELQELTKKINEVGELGNQLVESYNRNVNVYNDTFSGEEAFTQGDYQGSSINIYKFSDQQELKTVLAHELGHALSLGHVEGTSSIMYYLMGGQPDDLKLSPQDLSEFIRVCGADDGVIESILRTLRLYVTQLQAKL